MSVGLIALLDDVAGFAKVAVASLDDAAAQASRAGVKAAGLLIDDAAVTPRFVTGLSPARELPIIGRIAVGSLKNKLFFLLPGAIVLSLVAPWAITPILMLGGLYLSYEGAEKVIEVIYGSHAAPVAEAAADPATLEARKVRGAIATDFILSAEIMAITLGEVAEASLTTRVVVLALVGVALTVVVYGTVALIVKADDAGLSLAANPRPVSTLLGLRAPSPGTVPGGADRALAPATRAFGRGLVLAMPWFLRLLSAVGTAAMLWVGGGILIHGLAGYGLTGPEHAIEEASAVAAGALAGISFLVPIARWLAAAVPAAALGLLAGAALVPLIQGLAAPVLSAAKARWAGRG